MAKSGSILYKYSTKIWITCVIVSPILTLVWMMLKTLRGWDNGYFEIIGMIIPISSVVLIPNWLVLIFAENLLAVTSMSETKRRIVTQVLVLVLWTWSLKLVIGESDIFNIDSTANLSVPYLLIVTFGVWYYKMETIEKGDTI